MAEVRTAVIAAAGFGTRFLPVTKAIPKEMIPILDLPSVHYLVDECVRSGVTKIIIVGRGQRSAIISDYFDSAPDVEKSLAAQGKEAMLERVRAVSRMADVVVIRQGDDVPYGNGSPVVQAAPFLARDEPFVYMFGDDLVKSDIPATKQLIDYYSQYQPAAVFGAAKVTAEEIHLYSSVKYLDNPHIPYQIEKQFEKPKPEEVASLYSQIGRFVLTSEVTDILQRRELGKGNELWLSEALAKLAQTRPVAAYPLDGTWFTTGDPFRMFQATLEYGLDRPDIAPQLRAYLKSIQDRL